MRILIADDSLVSAQYLEKVLLNLGHKTFVCHDGTEAWEKIKKEDSPEICILDRSMPGIEGTVLTEKIRESKLKKYIIILSAKDAKEELNEGLESGADDYICKPFREEELKFRLKAAKRILDLESRISEYEG